MRESEERLRKAIADLEASRWALEEKIDDLERFHDLTVGREIKMMELEREIDRLRLENGALKADGKLQSSP